MSRKKNGLVSGGVVGGRPDMRLLRAELDGVLSSAGVIRARQRVAEEIRHSRWKGQSDDFRKHREKGVDVAFEGSADTRMSVVDMLINERVALMLEALLQGEIQVLPQGLDEAEGAGKLTRVLKWVRDVLLQPTLRKEAALLANFMEGDDPGVGVLKVWWRREVGVELRRLSVDEVFGELLRVRGVELPEGAVEVPPEFVGAVDDVQSVLWDPLRREEALAMLGAAFPTVEERLLRKALRGLQRRGEVELPMAFVKRNGPALAALRYMEDVFFPPDVDGIEGCRVVFQREWLSEEELNARVVCDGWDRDWVAEVLEAGTGGGADVLETGKLFGGEREVEKLHEVWHAYFRASDGYGVPGVYWTVFSEKVPEGWGVHELLDYPDGEMPFVLFQREAIGRGVERSRGVPSLAGSSQYEIKVQRDCRTDATQLATLPPLRVKMRRGGIDMALGPKSLVTVRDKEDVTWMQPPQFPSGSVEVERAARSDLDQYFGRLVEGVAPELRNAVLQNMVNGWLEGWITAWGKMGQLLQAFMDPVDLAYAAGGEMERLTRDEIRGRFHLLLSFSVENLNLEFVMKRLDAIGRVLAWDVGGVADRSALMRIAMRGIDPKITDAVMRDLGSASGAEIKDELDVLAKMALGIESPLQESGINAGLRLRTLEESVMKSPVLTRKLMRPANDEDELFGKLVENRRKNLSFLMEQTLVNPEVGRTGTRQIMN